MGFGKLLKTSLGHVVGVTNSSKKSSSQKQQIQQNQQQQMAIGFGSNFYWAIACANTSTNIVTATVDDKNHNACICQWTSHNTPPWKATTQQQQSTTGIMKKKKQHHDNNPNHDIIESVVCSAQSTIYLTKSGDIYQHGTMHGMVYARPVRIALPPLPFKIKEISAGRHHAIALFDMGVGVVSWGAGHFGQLGIGNTSTSLLSSDDDDMDDSDDESSSNRSGSNNKKKKGNTSNTNSYERSNQYGQLMYTSKPLLIERLLPHNNVEGSPVISIAAGDWHSLALTASGTIWAWGCNRNLQCGRDPESCSDANNTALLKLIVEYAIPNDIPHPQQPSPLFSSKFMSPHRQQASNQPPHVTDDDENDSDNNDDNKNKTKQSDTDDLSGPIVPTIMSPTPIPLPVPMIQISAGRAHSVSIAKDTKHVYCWGNNHYGQCGNIISNRYLNPGIKPHVVKALCDLDVHKVAAGGNHTLALTSTGQVYSWGNHAEGQLGIMGGLSIGSVAQCKPRLVTELDFHASTMEAEHHNNAANKESRTSNDHNIVQHGSHASSVRHGATLSTTTTSTTKSASIENATTSHVTQTIASRDVNTTIAAAEKKTPYITDIYAAGTYSAVISSSGFLYVWGSNDAGQLGIPKPSDPNHIPFLRDGSKLPFSKGRIGNDTSPFGSSTSLPLQQHQPQLVISYQALKKKSAKRLIRNVHTFDSNHNILLPTRVEYVNHIHVQQIACGPNHMWVIGEPRKKTQEHHGTIHQHSLNNTGIRNSGDHVFHHAGEQTMYEVRMQHLMKQEAEETNDNSERQDMDRPDNHHIKVHTPVRRRVNSSDDADLLSALSDHQPPLLRRANSAPGDEITKIISSNCYHDDDYSDSQEDKATNSPYLPTSYHTDNITMINQDQKDLEYEMTDMNRPSGGGHLIGSSNSNFLQRVTQKILRRRSSCSTGSGTGNETSTNQYPPTLLLDMTQQDSKKDHDDDFYSPGSSRRKLRSKKK